MSGFCTDLDEETLRQSQIYYQKLLSSLSQRYDSFHKIIHQFLCIIGVIANICVVVVLLRPTMRKNPFNLFLIGIAICDGLLMASYFIYKQIELCHPLYFTFTWIVFTYSYALSSVLFHSASLWITVNMAVLRYLVLKSSSNSSRNWPRLNTYKAASFSIFAAILIAAVGSAPNMLRYKISYKGELPVPDICLANVDAYVLIQPNFWNCTWERFSFWIAGLLLKLVPCLLLTIFMTLLVRMLVEARDRRNRLQFKQPPPSSLPTQNNGKDKSVIEKGNTANNSGTSNKAQAERTTAMLTIIVAVFLITELPQGILVVWIGVKPQVRFAMAQLSNILDFLSLLNSSVNFLLYATMSNLFRHEFLQTFGQCCPKRIFTLLNLNKNHKASTERSSIPKGGGIGHDKDFQPETQKETPPSSFGSEERFSSSEKDNRKVISNNGKNDAFSSSNFSNVGNKQRKILVALDKCEDSTYTELEKHNQLLTKNNTSKNIVQTLKKKQHETELSQKLLSSQCVYSGAATNAQ
ncbi:hypothetical protein Mgra_00006616 [Meloidogyne graminicola]|uniref:G-protein coupled receptors family 1 profile domain-containing protein n=1 Tax=Meloidogyne graminicola TaxID=189291 RepID=A0A8S9ZKV2_9BILA|nr:hypothetical protein Mgra_00006616 [Meloidogyne graminicola]